MILPYYGKQVEILGVDVLIDRYYYRLQQASMPPEMRGWVSYRFKYTTTLPPKRRLTKRLRLL